MTSPGLRTSPDMLSPETGLTVFPVTSLSDQCPAPSYHLRTFIIFARYFIHFTQFLVLLFVLSTFHLLNLDEVNLLTLYKSVVGLGDQ